MICFSRKFWQKQKVSLKGYCQPESLLLKRVRTERAFKKDVLPQRNFEPIHLGGLRDVGQVVLPPHVIVNVAGRQAQKAANATFKARNLFNTFGNGFSFRWKTENHWLQNFSYKFRNYTQDVRLFYLNSKLSIHLPQKTKTFRCFSKTKVTENELTYSWLKVWLTVDCLFVDIPW